VLERKWAVIYFKMDRNLKILEFRSCVFEASFPLEYGVTSLGTLFLIFRTIHCSGNVGRNLCTEAVSCSRRTEYFVHLFESGKFWCSANHTLFDLII